MNENDLVVLLAWDDRVRNIVYLWEGLTKEKRVEIAEKADEMIKKAQKQRAKT